MLQGQEMRCYRNRRCEMRDAAVKDERWGMLQGGVMRDTVEI